MIIKGKFPQHRQHGGAIFVNLQKITKIIAKKYKKDLTRSFVLLKWPPATQKSTKRNGDNNMETTQLIWTGCDAYELADQFNSEVPNFPIQLANGTWKHEPDFDGQRVYFAPRDVFFGIECERADDYRIDEIDEDILITDCGAVFRVF